MAECDNGGTTPNGIETLRAAANGNATEPAPRKRAGGLRITGAGFKSEIFDHWGESPKEEVTRSPLADDAAKHRDDFAASLPGERLVIPAGAIRFRTNDVTYNFRVSTPFAHLTGLGGDIEPGPVLVINPVVNADGTVGHHDVLYVAPAIGHDNPRFYSDAMHGEFWVGPAPDLADYTTMTGIETRDIASLAGDLAEQVGPKGLRLRVFRGADPAVESTVDRIRLEAGLGDADANLPLDQVLEEREDELRIIKTPREIEQIREAIRATERGFERVADVISLAPKVRRGERLIESVFMGSCRYEANDVSFETVVGSGRRSTFLHYMINNHPVSEGDAVVLDAGAESQYLYAADVTRTLPVSGHYSPAQRRVAEAVLAASDAAIAAANKPGARYRDLMAAAMDSIAHSLEDMGILTVSAAESLKPDGEQHCRWLYHGTGHHLGLDCHDAQHARDEYYPDAELKPGMVFTMEPGLYFHDNDLLVPEEYRGIGVRLEDDLLVTDSGEVVILSDGVPRSPEGIEAWMAEHGPERYIADLTGFDPKD